MKILANNFLHHFRQGELKVAKSILRWKLEKEGLRSLEDEELDAAASRLLEQARIIARRSGKNLYDILKEETREFFRSKPP